MNLDMAQLATYKREIEEWEEKLKEAKDKLEFLRLQAKQTRASAARAKRDPTIKAFIKAMPKDHVEVMPAPGSVYVSIHLSPMQASLYADVPDKLGLQLIESKKLSASLSAPTLTVYRTPGAVFYITKHTI